MATKCIFDYQDHLKGRSFHNTIFYSTILLCSNKFAIDAMRMEIIYSQPKNRKVENKHLFYFAALDMLFDIGSIEFTKPSTGFPKK